MKKKSYLCKRKQAKGDFNPPSYKTCSADLPMLLLMVADYENRHVSIQNTYKDDAVALAIRDMEECAEHYKKCRIIEDAHYPKELADAFFHHSDMSIHCVADCGDDIEWKLVKVYY